MGRISWAKRDKPCGLGWTEQAERDGLSRAVQAVWAGLSYGLDMDLATAVWAGLSCGLDMDWATASRGWSGLGWAGQAVWAGLLCGLDWEG